MTVPALLQRKYLAQAAGVIAFIAAYVVADWFSYIEPMYGLDITPWNPAPALGLVYWLKRGKAVAPAWLAALLIADLLVRDVPAGWLLTILSSLWLVIGYGLIGEALRRNFTAETLFDNRRQLLVWFGTIFVGTLLTSLVYLGLLDFSELIPPGEWGNAFLSFWVGDLVGILVTMPLLWLLAGGEGRGHLRTTVMRLETAGYMALLVLVLVLVFWFDPFSEFNHAYFLFLPVAWAAARQGLAGTSLIAFVMQIAVVVVVEWLIEVDMSVLEFQLLGAVLALVGFFTGVVVDEQRKTAESLKQTLRLTAAGDMAAALAHELNQPITALSAYGKACEILVARGETGAALRDAISRMVAESVRAADVVRRMRDFFRTGAVRLESVELDTLLATAIRSSAQLAGDHGVTLAIQPLPAARLLVDRLQFEVVLHNLLANAIDAVLGAADEVRRVDLSAELLSTGKIRLTVEDSGPGISAATAARLFEPFVSSKSSGLGLGLVISRAIVEAHGGRLWAEIGDHGIFRFELPLEESAEDAQP